MNSYYKFLFFVLFVSCSIFTIAQENLNIDYSIIKENMEKDSITYIRLKSRYERNDSTLTYPEYAILYYGYSFTPQYAIKEDADKKELERLIDNQKYQDAYLLGRKILQRNPVALYALYNMYYLSQTLNRSPQEINSYIIKYSGILHTIALSGDGKSESTAFRVITTDDMYQLAYNYWGVNEITLQYQVGIYEVIEFTQSQHYKENRMYFEIANQ